MIRSTSGLLKIRVCISLTFICTILLSACANNRPVQKPKGVGTEFTTRISDSGLKVFRLSATTKQQLQSSAGSPTSDRHLSKWLEQELIRQLLSSNFCETGHTEIERSIGTGFALIRGECNELATDQ